MITKTVIKLFFLLIISNILVSCVNNDDEENIGPIREKLDLTPEVLAGTWEVYFFTKDIIPLATNISTKYRYTEVDGFTVTFLKDGTYYENNIFGHRNLEGTYKIAHYSEDTAVVMKGAGPKNDPNLKNNAVFMSYKSPKTKNDTLSKAEIPAMFETDFTFRDRYEGDAQGHKYRVEDLRHYRNTAKAPNYIPNEREFHKNVLELNDVLGRWRFDNYYKKVDQHYFEAPDHIRVHFGDHYVFKMVGGKQVFEEYLKSNTTVPLKTGDFKIIDDVINVYTEWKYTDKEGNVKDSIESYKFWIKDAMPADKSKLSSFDKYRDIENVLKITEEYDFFTRVGDK